MAKSGYYFYLKKCLLPVTPSKLTMKINNKNETLTLIDQGEINILKTAGLTDIDFECLIPQVEYPFAVYKSGFKKAKYFLDYFEELKSNKKPFQFIVSRARPDGTVLFSTNIKVSLEDYKIVEQHTQGFDLTVSISLKQWRSYGTKTVKVVVSETETTATTTESRSEETSPAPSTSITYTVVSGDTLWAIAKKYYGDGSQYTKIYQANTDIISNPNLIYPGWVLTIPAT